MTAPTQPGQDAAIRVSAMPADANAYGDIFGGWLMSLMDSAAGLVAARHSHGRAVTIAMDGMQFHAPVHVGDEVWAAVRDARFHYNRGTVRNYWNYSQ